MSDQRFIIIGLPDNGEMPLVPEAERAIRDGRVFSGGKRHHTLVSHILPEDALWIDISVPLEKVFQEYRKHREMIVFASGDPLFYGFAVTLQREFPEAEMVVYPFFNSLQMLAHKLLLPYSDMINISVTGRPWRSLDAALIRKERLIGLLTDRKKGPAEIAARLLYYGYSNYMAYVGESLGNRTESVRRLSLEETAAGSFRFPNCMILQMTERRGIDFGIPERLFSHLQGRENMITKMPVRLLSISMLGLEGKSVMWDVGFCTGSVSIEAKLHYPELEIIAFERREESRRLLEENCRRFGTPGIEGVIADFMECDLTGYPKPDAVFIGGHGGRLEEMTEIIFRSLNPGGTVVFNSVSDESCRQFKNAVEKCGRKIAESHLIGIDAHNPIMIMKAV